MTNSNYYHKKDKSITISRFLNLIKARQNQMQVDFEFLDLIPRERSGKLRDFVQEMNIDDLSGRRPLTGADIRNNED